jgi:hypothetical protein
MKDALFTSELTANFAYSIQFRQLRKEQLIPLPCAVTLIGTNNVRHNIVTTKFLFLISVYFKLNFNF